MNASRTVAPVTGAVTRFLGGAGLLLRGLGMYVRSPKLMLLGIVPALISGVLYLAVFAALLYFVDDLAAWLTPFADDWSSTARGLLRVAAGLAVVGVAALLGVLTFTAVTLAVGDPFYEAISERVEDRLGGTPGKVDVPFWASLRRSVVDSLRLVAISALIGVPLFAAGFIPVVGQTVVPVVGALVGGWFLALELVGAPFYRRGMRLPDRRSRLRADRPTALGFGVAVFLCFLIPLGAVLVMPAAVAGAALLARRSLGQHTEEQ
ncbi:EI24 domain-containing protein [Micromonospora sp. WMMD1128]|uniref:EI24 domain-containing protein n=1 Tax=unclassified Micromonospora TaxID=2617518 RepID=UPI00248CC3BE|nr:MULTISPECIES: EI24 domain-containing protein [unclassified Micromonospora]WBB74256.1 EI24 domain-containing protein [Micromonospora sp. WMMD1128]WFE32360.1 EI24 domain-containing protein [Micromonospora sp. WMMD975]